MMLDGKITALAVPGGAGEEVRAPGPHDYESRLLHTGLDVNVTVANREPIESLGVQLDR